MHNLFKKRQSKDVKTSTKDTRSKSDSPDDSTTSKRVTKTDNGSSKDMKATQNDKSSPSQTRSSTADAALEVKTYTLINILDLARSTAEMDFTTPELRELLLDMKAWLARAKSEVEEKDQNGMKDDGEASTDAALRKRHRGHLLILAEIISIVYRLEERLRRREKFWGELRFRGKMFRKKVKDVFERLKGRSGCKREQEDGDDGK